MREDPDAITKVTILSLSGRAPGQSRGKFRHSGRSRGNRLFAGQRASTFSEKPAPHCHVTRTRINPDPFGRGSKALPTTAPKLHSSEGYESPTSRRFQRKVG